MPLYITLLSWTDQGIRAYADTAGRADAFGAALRDVGGRLVDIYWTVGPYDLVAVVEAPDDETAAAALLRLGAVGNIRSTTMRAFGRDEVEGIIAKASA
ncbi:GYD domain-containing protein [Actinacidiphila glaucinigra]|uniref:GYD domain-containing protein n=1 Tax=Actinacidiphila glaucinigra TaxID=235986 RepID=UPI002DD99E60|nr:GYD domain-containing protein [Actinacidiphila glaucinigra]WSD61620.1 GYD domain-containing protein [Actinacidiphila glaucinigra]